MEPATAISSGVASSKRSSKLLVSCRYLTKEVKRCWKVRKDTQTSLKKEKEKTNKQTSIQISYHMYIYIYMNDDKPNNVNRQPVVDKDKTEEEAISD
jgi:hypothetical protein